MNCPNCLSVTLMHLEKFSGGSVMQNKLYRTLEAALKEKNTSINLYGCTRCGFVFNADFKNADVDYSGDYDNSPDHSALFGTYLNTLAKKLIVRHELLSKRVLEIGCGKGQFLERLYGLGVRHLQGFDPAYEKQRTVLDTLVVPSVFNPKKVRGKADMIISKETFEHIPAIREFTALVLQALARNGTVYIEVPNLEWVAAHRVFFDFTYEHCNYFTRASLFHLFEQFGFGAIRFSFPIGGQYIAAEIRQGKRKKPDPFDVRRVAGFIRHETDRYRKQMRSWRRFAIWGVAGKGVTFVNRLGITRRQSPIAIDINPQKHGRFVPITGQVVRGPEILQKGMIDSIIIMNPIYEKEIKAEAKKRGFRGKFFLPYSTHGSP